MTDSDERERGGALPQRNFTITVAEQVRALVAGPPAYALRRRRIEDLEARLVRSFAAYESQSGIELDPGDRDTLPRGTARAMAALNALVDAHNRYYPIEANLRMDPRTGELLDWGKPWTPMPAFTLEQLIEAARRR